MVDDPQTLFSRALIQQNHIYKDATFNASPEDFPIAVRSNFWKMTASLYEPLWRHKSLSLLTLGEISVREELSTMLEWLTLNEEATVLDAGCSAGLYSRHILEHHPALDVHAIDMSEVFLQEAVKQAEKEKLAINFVEADVHNLPYQNASMDALVSGGSLNEFKDLGLAFSEFNRVLKPDGKLWLMFLAESNQLPDKWLQHLSNKGGINFPSQDDVIDTLKGLGLKLSKHKRKRDIVFLLCEKTS